MTSSITSAPRQQLRGGGSRACLIFLRDFEEIPSVVATINGDGWKIVDIAHVAKVAAGQCEIHTGDYYGALADRPFSFIAVG